MALRLRPGQTPDPRAQLPLSAVVLHILLALADGEMHGYAIAQEIDAATAGEVRTGPGTLYGSIQRMLTAALIEEAPHRRRADDDDERRRYYRTTAFGRRVLALELERLVGVIATARTKNLIRGAEPA
jgi:DNA-binding PadR family transcriptional regulator